jgi:hypothetical protein
MAQNVNTAHPRHRKIQLATIDDVLAELDRISQADKEGRLRSTGNWTVGQILAHVAAWIDYGYTGYPVKPPPFPFNFILRWMGKRILKKGMRPGVRIPGVKDGTFGQEQIATDVGMERLRKAFLRLKNGEQCKYDSPAFGPMSHDDRILLNLRHAELHLGFIQY